MIMFNRVGHRTEDLNKLCDAVASAVSPKPRQFIQAQPDPIPPSIAEKAPLLLERGDERQRAWALIALNGPAKLI